MRHTTRLPLVPGMVLAMLPLLAGCGGGSGKAAGKSGALRITLEFPPAPTRVDTAAIPAATNGFRVRVSDPGNGRPLIDDVIVAREAGATQTVDVKGLRTGPVKAEVSAHQSQDGTGAPIASGDAQDTIAAGQTTSVNIVLTVLPSTVVLFFPVTPGLPATPHVEEGTTRQLQAVVYDVDANAMPGPSCTWSSSDMSMASVDATGMVAGNTPGVCTITATETATGVQGALQVTVWRRLPSTATVDPSQASILVGDVQRLDARAFDSTSQELTTATCTWSVDNPSLARVTSVGGRSAEVTGLAAGDVVVTANFGPGGVVPAAAGDVVATAAVHISAASATSYAFVLKWGSPGAGDGQFNWPIGVALDSAGNVYVAEYYNNRIQKFTGSGTFITKWGSRGTGDGQFNTPIRVAVDSAGNVYVADRNNNRVQKFADDGTFITKWGSGGSGDGQFNFPYGVPVDSAGNVYVADLRNNRIQKFTDSGTFITKWGSTGTGDGQFSGPTGVGVDSAGNVYVVEWVSNRVQKFTSSGTFITKWGTPGTGDGQFDYPVGLAVDSAGNVYVSDAENYRIQKFTGSGTFITKWGTPGTGDGQFGWPEDVAVDSAGNVYVADRDQNCIHKFAPVSP